MKLLTRRANWAEEHSAITHLRTRVFVEEQGVSPDIEQDGEDDKSTTRHFLGFIADQAVATGRVLACGKIGRICLLQEHRGMGLGKEFLRSLLIELLENGEDSEFYLHAQIQALEFYRQCGFVAEGEIFQEAGIDHQRMRINLDDRQLAPLLYRDQVRRCSEIIEFREHALRIINAGVRRIDILSLELHNDMFNETVAQAVSRFVRRHRIAQARILVQNTKDLPKRLHPFVALAQRLPSRVHIKTLSESPQKPEQGYICVDASGLVFFNDEANWEGFVNYQAAAESAHQLEEFDRLWQRHSVNDPNLARLSL